MFYDPGELTDHVFSKIMSPGTSGPDCLPESLRIAQKDIYNAFRRRLTEVAHLDKDGNKSLELWAEALRARGYKVLYEETAQRLSMEDTFVFALCSPWQQKVELLIQMIK